MLVNLIRTALARLHPPAGYVILILMLEKLCSGVRYRTVLCHAPKQQEKGIPMKIGFDNNKYLAMQSAHIRERISQFDNKLYLEFGGKLFDDYHASRVLPGFQPDSKLQMLIGGFVIFMIPQVVGGVVVGRTKNQILSERKDLYIGQHSTIPA